jgi:hypothetical protein
MIFWLRCSNEECDLYGIDRQLLAEEPPPADDERRTCTSCSGVLDIESDHQAEPTGGE